MTDRKTDVGAAIALLERVDPADQERLVAELDMSFAQQRIARLIAADTVARDRRRRVRRRLPIGRSRRATILSVVTAVAVVVAVVALDTSSSQLPSAQAKTISGALRALTAPAGSILHIDATTTQTSVGHPTYTWRQDVYEQLALPFRTRILDQRLRGTLPGTEAVYGIGIGEQTYDPSNNTIYAPNVPKPKAVPGTPTLTPAQQARLFEPFMAQYIRQLRAKLASGAARVVGRTTVENRAAIKIAFAGTAEMDYVAADGTYAPIETIQGTLSSANGKLIRKFHTFEYLAMAGHAGLLNLKTQHPDAQIDRSLADFRAAGKRLFRGG